MPPKLSARQMFWTGAILTIVGVVLQQYLSLVIHSIWGSDALQALVNSPWSLVLYGSPVQPLVPLGVILVACSLIARNLEVADDSQPMASRWRPTPPRLTARQIAWTGVVLVVIGLILTNTVEDMLMSLAWKADFASNLARDLLSIVAHPMGWIAFPLGTALLPCSLVVRMLESRTRDREAQSAARIID